MTVIAQPPAAGRDPLAGAGPALDLVRAAVAGDRLATRRLMAVLRPVVLRYCRARLGTTAAASDVAREVSAAIASALPTAADAGVPFPAVVHRIARRRVDRIDTGAGSAVAGSMPAMLRGLTPVEREVLVLRVAVGLSVENTASAVGSTPQDVRLAQHRALQQLRAAF